MTARARGKEDTNVVSTLQLADWPQKPIDPQRLLGFDSHRCWRGRAIADAGILHVEDDVSLTELVKELLEGEADVIAAHSLRAAKGVGG